MLDINKTYAEHVDFFERNKISIDHPGFYDDPKFIAFEQRNSRFLNTYASFVKKKPFSNDYLSKTRHIVKSASEYLYNELKKDGSLGQCVDLSIVFNKILEKFGVWNFIQKGSLTITFPSETNFLPQYFRSVSPNPNFLAGHAWITAPPFDIIDLTILHQPYKQPVHNIIPQYIIAEKTKKGKITVDDIFEPEFEPEYMFLLRHRYKTDREVIKIVQPQILDYSKAFPPSHLIIDNVNFNYIPVALGLPDEPLETIQKGINGKMAFQLYEEIKRLI